MKKMGYDDFADEILRQHGGDRTNYDSLAQDLMNSKVIPTSAKAEISQQVDFDRKYRFSKNDYLKLYLKELAEYFEVPLPRK